jgi:multiple sugar transport system permease protein
MTAGSAVDLRSHTHVATRRGADHQGLVALTFVLPTILGLAFFYLGPVVASFFIGFTDWNALTQPAWTGLSNYLELLNTEVFWTALVNSIIYMIGVVVPSMFLGFLAALLLNRNTRLAWFYRSVYFLPYIPSVVAVGIIWSWLFEPQYGVINYLLSLIGIDGPGWFSSSAWALPALILLSVWRVAGYNMVIYLAGLQAIPRDLIEAARVDGAAGFQLTVRILVPLLSPTTFFALIVGIIGSYQIFEITFVTTQGGPGYATQTLPYYVYQLGFQFFQFGLASAVAYVLFFLVIVITAVIFLTERHWVHYG